MKTTVLSTLSDKIQGVKGRSSLNEDEVFIFKHVEPKTAFHMVGVKFPIDIAFLDQDFGILDIKTMESETGTAIAPEDTVLAVEACKGYFENNKLKVDDFWIALYIGL